MTGWAVNSMAKAIEGSIPFLPSYDFINPNAGIGRQDNLKIYWYLSWTFKSFFGYIYIYRPIRPMVKTKLFHCWNRGSNPLWVISYNVFFIIQKIKRGYSLIGKTAILHIVNLGSSPNISNILF
jgi:hypothetical protein